jgi:uncharacterized membrane-anchored protein YjiN (DUF445 family)
MKKKSSKSKAHDLPPFERTSFDRLFQAAIFAQEFCEKPENDPAGRVARRLIKKLGLVFAAGLTKAKSDDLRELADALDKYRSPDKVRECTYEVLRSFPECKIATRDVVRNLKQWGVQITKENERTFKKSIQRAAKEFGQQLDGKPGRPGAPKELRQRA